MKVGITGFSGEQPRVLPTMLPDAGAREAWDVRLDDGGLTPTRRSRLVATVTANHRTIYRHNGTWLSRAGDVHFAPGPVAQDRLYYTGDGAPKMQVAGVVYPLALPPPAAALTASATGSGTGEVFTRLYVYTWVTSFGEESEPCPVSNELLWQSGKTVTLTGFASAPAGRGITKQRIYRSQTGKVGTYLYLIAERNASNSDFTDTVPVDTFGESLPSADWNAPPDGLTGLVSMANGMMAAFTGRDVYFCEPWRPHAWPEKYVLTVDYPVVALAAIDTTLLIMTEGQPYVAQGTHPSTMAQKRIELNLPCINARGVVNLGFAVCYPSHDGLVSMSAGGTPSLVTGNLFRKDDWQALSPQTAIGSQLGQRYMMFYDTMVGTRRNAGAFAIDLSGTAFLVRHTITAGAAWYDLRNSALYYCAPGSGEVQELHPTEGSPNVLSWSSKEFLLPAPHNFGVILVDSLAALTAADQAALDADRAAVLAQLAAAIPISDLGAPINAKPIGELLVGGDVFSVSLAAISGPEFEAIVIADGEPKFSIRHLDRPVRLPAGFKARSWEIAVRSNVSVKQITLATSMADLTS
ncbi:hypothetical protein [Phreatobacter oligotrophus]|uniref:Uncharacterized protein n=1 Tax=Phreatobacter oligotrophus TaxID=1122261 RepID=A0A2T4ZIW5_9HYPH|nr:hypothetical protein [Phreatobacter oligotrophus]PTM61908.1 hypothetical protein C8P69_101581 [Phreatobacter oligotrophus]